MDDEDSEDWKEFEAFSDGLDEQFNDDAVSIPASDTTQNEFRRPEWWQHVPFETRQAVRDAERFIAQNPALRQDVGNSRVIWDAVTNRLEAAVHSSALSGRGGVARKSATIWLPVQVLNQSRSVDPFVISSSDEGFDELSSDTAAIEPVPAPSSRPRNHLPSIRDLFDSDSEELQSSAHQKHLDSPKIESKYRSKHRVEADVPRSSPHTPENKVKSHAHKAKDDVESPLFVSPLAALEIINTYPRHNQKKDEQNASRAAKASASELKQGNKRRHEDRPEPSYSRASKTARTAFSGYDPRLQSISDDSEFDEKPSKKKVQQRLNSNDSSVFEPQERSDVQPQDGPSRIDDGNVRNRCNRGVRTGRLIRAEDSSHSSSESSETKTARSKVREANLVKRRKRSAKREGALKDAAYHADKPHSKLYAPREVLEDEGLRNIARREGVHVTYDETKEYYNHNRHIRSINTTNKPAPAPIHPEYTPDDRERFGCSSPEPVVEPRREDPWTRQSSIDARPDRSHSFSRPHSVQRPRQPSANERLEISHSRLPVDPFSERPRGSSHSRPSQRSRPSSNKRRSGNSHNFSIPAQQQRLNDMTYRRAELYQPPMHQQTAPSLQQSQGRNLTFTHADAGDWENSDAMKQIQEEANKAPWWMAMLEKK